MITLFALANILSCVKHGLSRMNSCSQFLLSDLDRPLFTVLLRLVQEVNGHRIICMGNWNSSQITQLNQVLLSTDSVTALSEVPPRSEQALSVNKIDTVWAARQQAAYHTALSPTPKETRSSSEPYNGDVSSVAPLQPLTLRFSTKSIWGTFRTYAPHGGKPSLTSLALSLTSSASLRGRKPLSTCPSPRALEVLCLTTPLRSILQTALLSPTAPQAEGSTSLSRA